MAGSVPDEAVYLDSLRRRRDLSVLLLLDVSGSTAEPGTVGRTVHQQQRAAVANLTVALHDLGDRVALYAYYSQGRAAVNMVPVKRFDDHLDARVIRRLNSLEPGAYSRLGAAIRHGSAVLEARGGTSRRLLVVLSDGLAYDHGYERAYGAADARRALDRGAPPGDRLRVPDGRSRAPTSSRCEGCSAAPRTRPSPGPSNSRRHRSAVPVGRCGRRRCRRGCRDIGACLKQTSVPVRLQCTATTRVTEGRYGNEPGSRTRMAPCRRPVQRPYYQAVGNEEAVFKAAYRQGLSLVLKGPTGCGKTRFVEAMAHDLGRPLITVACHDDLTTADLVGRYLLRGDETVWVDGPLTRAVREGAICYLDEVVEARQDTTVVLHPLGRPPTAAADRAARRSPSTRRRDSARGVVQPRLPERLKDLKDSTRQRMVAIEFGFPAPEVEEGIVATKRASTPNGG